MDLRPWWVQWWKEPGVGLVSQSQRNQDLKAQQFKSRICWSGVSNSWLYMKRAVARSRPFRGVHTRERVQIDKKSTGGPTAHRGQPAHQRSSARASECSSSDRSKNTDAKSAMGL